MRGIHGTSTTMTPDRFFNDMQQLASQSPRDAADVANTWRNRYLNAADEGALTPMQKGWGALTSFLAGGLFGGMSGFFKAEDDDIWMDWNGGGYAIANLPNAAAGSPYVEGHAVDKERYPSMKPGTLWGIPYALPATVVVAAGAIWTRSYLLEHAAVAGLSILGSQLGDMLAYDFNLGRIQKAQAEVGTQTT